MSFLREIHDINKQRARKKLPEIARKTHDVKKIFDKKYNVIAEIKFASPSQGQLRDKKDPVEIAEGYLNAGARMLSVLTEPIYFQGELEYLQAVREARPDAVLLRKDFIVDEYQLQEARAYGADAALLIVAMTGYEQTKDLLETARGLDLAPLVEVHDEDEMEQALKMGADFIGVNNRNLKTLKIDLDTGRRLARLKPANTVFVCESGLSTADDVREMQALGYDGFLMGTHFMRQPDPGGALQKLMEELACA